MSDSASLSCLAPKWQDFWKKYISHLRQQCHNTAVSQHNSITTQQCHNTTVSQHNSVTTQQCHKSKFVIFHKKILKVLKCCNFL